MKPQYMNLLQTFVKKVKFKNLSGENWRKLNRGPNFVFKCKISICFGHLRVAFPSFCLAKINYANT